MSESGNIGTKLSAIAGLVADKIIDGEISKPDEIVSSFKVLVNYYAICNKLGLANAEGEALQLMNQRIQSATKKESKNVSGETDQRAAGGARPAGADGTADAGIVPFIGGGARRPTKS